MDSRKNDRELGNFIYDCYLKTHLTVASFAKAISVELRTVNYYFNGQRKPSARKILQIIKVARVDLENIPF